MEEKSIGKELFIIGLKQSRNAFVDFANLYNAISSYEFNPNEQNIELLELQMMICNKGMPLPSGRWGNQLAVALEMQKYIGALYIINNADRLGIDLEHVSSVMGGKDIWDVSKVFELSKQSFNFTKINSDDEDYKDYSSVIKYKNDNIEAAREIEEILNKRYPKRNRLK